MTAIPHFRIANKFIDDNILLSFSGDELKIYLVLFRRSNSGRDHCLCSDSSISSNTGIRVEDIPSIIKSLEKKGFVKMEAKLYSNSTPEYRVFGSPTATVPTITSKLAINTPTNETFLNYRDALLNYCMSNSNLRSYSYQIKSDSPISEFTFRLGKELDDSQKDQIYNSILEAIKAGNTSIMDSLLVDFTSDDIAIVKASYNISIALNMSNDEIEKRNLLLSTDGYVEWLEDRYTKSLEKDL